MEEVEFCNPFDRKKYDYYMKLEHAGRYCFAKNFIKNNDLHMIADIACATGYGTELLVSEDVFIDGYEKNIKYLQKANKIKNKNLRFYQIDLNEKNSINKKYDCIISFETLEHIENTNNFLDFINSILKINGYLLLSVPNALYEQIDAEGNILYKYHKHIFSKEQIAQLLKKYKIEVQEVLGQSLCNHIVDNIKNLTLENDKHFCKQKDLNKYSFSKNSIIYNSMIFAYPTAKNIDDSYSYIYICKKNN